MKYNERQNYYTDYRLNSFSWTFSGHGSLLWVEGVQPLWLSAGWQPPHTFKDIVVNSQAHNSSANKNIKFLKTRIATKSLELRARNSNLRPTRGKGLNHHAITAISYQYVVKPIVNIHSLNYLSPPPRSLLFFYFTDSSIRSFNSLKKVHRKLSKVLFFRYR